MTEQDYQRERAHRLEEKERQEYIRRVCACYNEELDLWNTGMLKKLEEERLEKQLRESLGLCQK